MTSTFLTAQWRELAMLSYEVEPSLLEPLVPAGAQLDRWQGRVFVSVIGFRFLETRVLGVPIPFHRNFDEVNLRFYVRREHPDGPRRGVVFIREIVPRAAIAWVARNVYNENYIALPMRHRVELPEVTYEWRYASKWARLSVTCEGEPFLPDEGSEEAFITEHYWGYAAQPDGGTLEYQVEHPRWKVWRSASAALEGDFEGLYGAKLAGCLQSHPSSAFVADGSGVIVRKGMELVL